MRYGLLADVHANLAALDAAVEALRDRDVEAFVCAGDVVGYGPQPNECIEKLRELGAVCVAGNHEQIVLGQLPDVGIHPWATETLRWTREELTADNRAWLETLPLRAEPGSGMTVAHGSLTDTRTYVRTPELARAQLAELAPGAVLVLGHTHQQLEYEDGGKLLVNPGAVGQSRERRVRAHAAVLDSDERAVEMLALPYDTRAASSALASRGLPAKTFDMRPSPARRVWLRLPDGVRGRVKRILGR
jgi:putative phosphoesterase